MLASCGLGEDNNQSMTKTVELTKQEIAVRNMTLNGSWEGKLYYVNNVKHENDSIDIVWKTDTVAKKVTISDFPVKLLAQYVDDESKELIANAADQSLVFDYYSVTSDYVEYYNMYYFRYQFTPIWMPRSARQWRTGPCRSFRLSWNPGGKGHAISQIPRET